VSHHRLDWRRRIDVDCDVTLTLIGRYCSDGVYGRAAKFLHTRCIRICGHRIWSMYDSCTLFRIRTRIWSSIRPSYTTVFHRRQKKVASKPVKVLVCVTKSLHFLKKVYRVLLADELKSSKNKKQKKTHNARLTKIWHKQVFLLLIVVIWSVTSTFCFLYLFSTLKRA